MTNERVYDLAETRIVGLLWKHVRVRKLRYFGPGHNLRRVYNCIERKKMPDLTFWEKMFHVLKFLTTFLLIIH